MDPRVARLGDVALGAAGYAAAVGVVVVRAGERVVAPVLPVLARPPLLPSSLTPAALVDRLAERGQSVRRDLTGQAQTLADVLVPGVTDLVLDRIDLTDLALTRLDIERIVKAALAEMDLNAIVRDQVDVIGLAESTVAGMDLDAIVMNQVDLVGLAEYVIDEIDLPEIIRESSGMVASEAVRGVRMQSMEADEAVSKIVDRILLRRKRRRTDAPGEPTSKDALDE